MTIDFRDFRQDFTIEDLDILTLAYATTIEERFSLLAQRIKEGRRDMMSDETLNCGATPEEVQEPTTESTVDGGAKPEVTGEGQEPEE